MNGNIVREIKRDLPEILGGNMEKLVENARRFGEYLGERGLTTSQIRNIFTDVKRLESYEKNRGDLVLLRPKLAYVAGKHEKKTKVIKDLQEVIDECIRRVKDEKSFKQFQNFFEAILAYHRYYGGKE